MSDPETPGEWGVMAVRFLLELGALVALGGWGLQATSGPLRYALAVAAPLIAAAVWGLFVAPKAPVSLGRWTRLGVSMLVFGAAVVALVATDRPVVAAGFGAVAVVDTALVYWRGLD